MPFQKATKYQSKLRLALVGIAGSGKTFTALSIASHMCGDARIALLDTERGSARKYSDDFDFDVLELTSFAPANYIEAIHEAERGGQHSVLIVDSLSHAWMGRDGVLEMKDRVDKAKPGSNQFTNWRAVTPEHNKLVDALLDCRLHLIVTMRAKMAYAVSDGDNGKTKVEKLGMEPIQRDGLDFEFDIVGDLTTENDLVIGKTRCSPLKGKVFREAGADVAAILNDWLVTGIEAPERPWRPDEALDWANYHMAESGLTDRQLKEALGIDTRWGEWTRGVEAANLALDAYIAQQSANGK